MSDSVEQPVGRAVDSLTLESVVTLGDGATITLGKLLDACLVDRSIRAEVERRSASQLSQGTTVALRSGGPPMTVVRISRKRGLVRCQWFDFDGRLCQRVFPSITLWQIDPNTGDALPIADPVSAQPGSVGQGTRRSPEVSDEDIPF